MTERDAAEFGGALDPVTQRFLESIAAELSALDRRPSEARAFLSRVQSGPVGKPSAVMQDLTFPVGPTGKVKARIVRPKDLQGDLPIAMYFCGGGWMHADRSTHDRLIREVAVGAGAALVFVERGRPPEGRFPNAIEQAYAATRYVVDQAAALGLDGTRLALIGDGVGGTMASAVTLLAKERRGPKIDLQVLVYPATDTECRTGSYEQFADGPWLTRRAMENFWRDYLPGSEQRRAITAAPLNASLDQLRNLPEALIIVAENDVLRDEGEAYGRKLSDAGVRVTSVRYNGAIHDFVMLNALADTPAVRSAIAQILSALKSAFG